MAWMEKHKELMASYMEWINGVDGETQGANGELYGTG